MANSYLIDIGMNDSQQDIVRKCNANFRRLASDQSRQSKSDIRQEASRADAMLASAVAEVNAAIKNGLNQIEQKLEEARLELTPHIGTYMYCDYDPNKKYKDTEWEQVDEGIVVVSSGKKYTPGETFDSITTKEEDDTPTLMAIPLWHRVR